MSRLLLTASGIFVAVFISVANGQEETALSSRYLERATEIANWLDSVAVKSDSGTFWPATPEDSFEPSNILYNGTPGVVLFYIELYRVNNDKRYLETAVAGGDWLIGQVKKLDEKSNAAFYTGAAGIGYTLNQLYAVSKQPRFLLASNDVFDWIIKSAIVKTVDGEKRAKWNDVTDIIGGSAGIGFYLVDFANRHPEKRQQATEMAIATGNQLVAVAINDNDSKGFKWNMSPVFAREMPNYSHGTAGVCDFLLSLGSLPQASANGEQKQPNRFITAARNGAVYLESLAYKKENANMIPHHYPEDGKLFYLGWCHGPTGTVGFLSRLARFEDDPEQSQRWNDLSNKLTHAMMSAGIPGKRSNGFWNNCGLCCGNAGAASFLLDFSKVNKNDKAIKLSDELTDDLLKRATKLKLNDGKTGLKWTHAEHRVRPEYLKAQTGLMQGASGIGIWLIKRHLFETGHHDSSLTDLALFPF